MILIKFRNLILNSQLKFYSYYIILLKISVFMKLIFSKNIEMFDFLLDDYILEFYHQPVKDGVHGIWLTCLVKGS